MSTSCSYLGNGLYAARLATLGALGADGRVSSTFGLLPVGKIRQIMTTFFLFLFFSGLDWKVFKSSCLPKKFREDVTFGGTTYKVSGIPDGKRKKKVPGVFDSPPGKLVAAMYTFLSQLQNPEEYCTIHVTRDELL